MHSWMVGSAMLDVYFTYDYLGCCISKCNVGCNFVESWTSNDVDPNPAYPCPTRGLFEIISYTLTLCRNCTSSTGASHKNVECIAQKFVAFANQAQCYFTRPRFHSAPLLVVIYNNNIHITWCYYCYVGGVRFTFIIWLVLGMHNTLVNSTPSSANAIITPFHRLHLQLKCLLAVGLSCCNVERI